MPSLLKEKIILGLKDALKKKEATRVQTLRLLIAAILNKEKEKRHRVAKEKENMSEKELQEKSQLTDEEILEVVTYEAKKRKEAIEEFKKGRREDLVEKETKELEILQRYLPEQLSEAELKELVETAIAEISAQSQKDIGRVMATLMPKIKGRADGSRVLQIVKEILK